MKKGFFLSSIAILALGALAGCSSPAPSSSSAAPGSSETPSSQAPSSQAPSSQAPSSQAPSSQAPSSGQQINVGEVKVWAAEAAQDVTAAQLERFKAQHPNYNISFKLEAVSEADVGTQVISDVGAAADVYFFAQDQLARLVSVAGIDEVYEDDAAIVRAANAPSVVSGASFNNKLYAYPATADNGYFMYYNKSFFEGVDMTDLSAICARAKELNKTVNFKYTDIWYGASMFFGAGLRSEWTTDARGRFISYQDNFNSEVGLKMATAMGELLSTPGLFDPDPSAATFRNTAAVVISGTWDANAAKEALGENFACTILPKVTVAGGEKYQMAGFSGLKLVGVKPQPTDIRAEVCAQVALALTDKTAQLERFDALNWGPSNLEAQNEQRVKDDVIVSTILAQNAFAVPQGQFPNDWWALGNGIGISLQQGADPATVLATYAAGLDNCLD